MLQGQMLWCLIDVSAISNRAPTQGYLIHHLRSNAKMIHVLGDLRLGEMQECKYIV